MPPPSPGLAQLARRIVEHEAGGASDPAAAAEAVETACRKLKDQLVDLLGSGGVSALMKRALHLAQRERPVLAEVAVNGESPQCFESLADSLAGSSDADAIATATAVLTHIFHLLVTLLGEDLGMKPIRKLWPQMTSAREIDR